jgi:AraC family transcriptional regulator
MEYFRPYESAWPASPPVLPEGIEILYATDAIAGRVGHAVIFEARPLDFLHTHPTSTLLFFDVHGTAQAEWQRGSRLVRFVASPGHFTITPAGEENRFAIDGPLQVLKLSFDASQIGSLAEREWNACTPSIEFSSVYHKSTLEIVSLLQSYAELVRNPRNGSRLYLETLWTQVAIQLLWNFSSLCRPQAPDVERLSDARVRRVIDYLRSSLGDEVSLSDLSDLAGLSPNYFLNAFKKATGKTPHRYLTELRIARACELLRNPQLPLVNVALAVGFSSQSHFTTIFGRYMGSTPALYRAQILGLRSGSD